ncbi:MAG: sigma-70 family RNA polymerase sigma factor [Cyclobacteriaceae bacterium]|jgi:RNA polymerase sigma-70 factor (ECF subfamily)|nr:sigma-70 family RNA polymerase sigma factor [Cyclobacteriaceae bacterium]
MTDPEFALIDGIVAGNQQGYAELVNRYKNYAFTLANKILGNRAEAEEAAQDAFIKAYHHLGAFKRDSRFSTWLYRIVFNTAISYKRKQKGHHQSIESAIIEYQAEDTGMLERQDKKKYLDKAINQLSEADKIAITLFYLQEFSLEEIAGITGMPANTVKVRIHRARIRLAEELKRLLKKEALTL